MRLRSVRLADIERLSSWLPNVAAEANCEPWASPQALANAKGSSGVLTNDTGTAFVAYQLGSPEADAARVDLLAVAPGERRLGIGGRTALALERRLRDRAKRVYTLVPSSIGLALYFWLRLGYRPLMKQMWPEPPARSPALWMVRDL